MLHLKKPQNYIWILRSFLHDQSLTKHFFIQSHNISGKRKYGKARDKMRWEIRRDIRWPDKEESFSTNLYFARGKQKRWDGTRGDIMLPDEEKLLWENLMLNILQEKKRHKKEWDETKIEKMRPFMSDEAKKKLEEVRQEEMGWEKKRKEIRKTFGHLNMKNTVQISLWEFGKKKQDGAVRDKERWDDMRHYVTW